MKHNAIIRIIIYSLLILILLGLLIGSLGFGHYFNNGRLHSHATAPTENPLLANEQDFSSQVQNIEIEWVAGSIVIHRSNSVNSIRIHEYTDYNSEYEMICHQSGQTLKIKFCKDSMEFPSFGINADVSKDLVIVVPENWNCNTLEIDAASADVQIKELVINELDFDGASGNLILENCHIVNLDIETASGDVKFSGILKDLAFEAASANFFGEFTQVPNRLNLDAMSGDLEIVLPSYAGFTCQLDAMSGSFDTDFDVTQSGSTYISGDGVCKIKVSAMSGDVNVLKGVDVPKSNS